MLARLQNCVVTPYNIVNDEGELVHFAFYAIQSMKFDHLRKQVNNERLCLERYRSEDQIVDNKTKAIQIEVFKKLKRLMCVKLLNTIN